MLRIDPNGTAAEAGLAQGDVILKVGTREMQNAQDLTSVLDEAARHSKQNVLALVRRDDHNVFVALPRELDIRFRPIEPSLVIPGLVPGIDLSARSEEPVI